MTTDLEAALNELSGCEPYEGKTAEEIAAAVILNARLESAVADVAQAVEAASDETRQQEKLRSGRIRAKRVEASANQPCLL